jgi:hypothetical protein
VNISADVGNRIQVFIRSRCQRSMVRLRPVELFSRCVLIGRELSERDGIQGRTALHSLRLCLLLHGQVVGSCSYSTGLRCIIEVSWVWTNQSVGKRRCQPVSARAHGSLRHANAYRTAVYSPPPDLRHCGKICCIWTALYPGISSARLML